MENGLKGKHVLFILLGFFGIVFAVNGVFLYDALSTLQGEERGSTYEAGLRYNATLAEERAQEALHWVHKSEALPGGSKLTVSINDAAGGPVAGLIVTGALERPATNAGEQALAFKETAAGRYEAGAAAGQPGAWVLSFTAQKPRPGDKPAIYRAKERIWIAAAR